MTVKTTWEMDHACGHPKAHELSARRVSERAGYARWLATTDCSDCWRTEHDRLTAGQREERLAARRAKKDAETEAWEALADMPVLDGSERTVDWARRVRRSLLVAAHGTLDMEEAQFAARITAPARLIKLASWWIDQSDCEPADLEELLAVAARDHRTAATEYPY
jgi:hypothetical protein